MHKNMTILKLDEFSIFDGKRANAVYQLSESSGLLNDEDFYIPSTSFWTESRVYLNLFNELIKSTPVYKRKLAPLSQLDFLFVLKTALILRNWKTNYSIFNALSSKKTNR
jgi:hypothetical protein